MDRLIISPNPPATPPLGTDLTNHDIAVVVVRAAALIDRHGLNPADFWTGDLGDYWPEAAPCDIVGALAIASGFRRKREVERAFIGFNSYAVRPPAQHPGTGRGHGVARVPVRRRPGRLAAADKPDAVTRLLEAAATIRTRGGAR